MSTFALLSTIVTLAALFGLVSHRVLRLPTSIGTTILSLGVALTLLLVGHFVPGLSVAAQGLVASIDFNRVVLHGLLAFLLFAGALQLNLEELSREKLSVVSLSIVATVLSTLFIAAAFRVTLLLIGIHLSSMAALLFGALISPTDPIAVLEMLRRVGAPPALEAQLAGESLFNDGVGAVLFLALVDASASGSLPSAGHFASLLLLEAGGGIAIGLALGYLTYRLICLVDSYKVEILLTLALAMGGYALADTLHVSAPLEAVTAGLLVSGRARAFAMSARTQENMDTFWELLDDVLNVVLFLLLGLELLVLPLRGRYVIAGLLAIPLALLGRLSSVALIIGALTAVRTRTPGSIRILTWGGLRGGLAVALALALPSVPGVNRSLLLVTTYVVVVFSIVVQGLTIAPLIRRLDPAAGSLAPLPATKI